MAGTFKTCLILEAPQFLSVSFIQLLKEDLGRVRKQVVGGKDYILLVLIIFFPNIRRETQLGRSDTNYQHLYRFRFTLGS